MPKVIGIHLEQHVGGPSQPFHRAGDDYKYRNASSLSDLPASLTPRLAVFYRNLIRLAELLKSQDLPVDFIDGTGAHVAMDLGCVKIAEHAGFIQLLSNGPSGGLESIRLSFAVSKPTSILN
jgi:hypothetical protein